MESCSVSLNPFEEEIVLPMIANILKYHVGVQNAITNQKIRQLLSDQGVFVPDSIVRKIIHHMRVSGEVFRLIASSNGYYISTEYEEVAGYISSLLGRVSEILRVIEALKKQLAALS